MLVNFAQEHSCTHTLILDELFNFSNFKVGPHNKVSKRVHYNKNLGHNNPPRPIGGIGNKHKAKVLNIKDKK